MLSFEVHRGLAELIASVHRVTAAASDRAPAAEIELLVDKALAVAARLEAMIGGDFHKLKRHLAWLRKRHREGKPAAADGDVTDLRQQDLLAVIEAVDQWSTRLLEPGLVAAISSSWQAQQYDAAVREAFVYTETQIRQLSKIDASSGLTGRKLISRLLPGNGSSAHWSAEGFLGHMTEPDQKGARDLLNGAFSVSQRVLA